MNRLRLVLLAAVVTWAGGWPQGALAQDAPGPPKAGSAGREAAFAEVEALLDSVRQTPANSRARLLQRLRDACARFLDDHGDSAPPGQLTRVASTWLQVRDESRDEKATRSRLTALARAEALPTDLRRQARVQVARLDVKVGARAPSWRVEGVTPETSLKRADLEGKLTLLVFWSPNDPTWREFSARKLLPLHQRFGEKDPFSLVAIATCPSRDELQRALKDQRLPGTQTFDPQRSCATSFGVAETPFLILLDESHTVLALGPAWRSAQPIARLLSERLEPADDR